MTKLELLSPAFQHDPFPSLRDCREQTPVVQASDVPAFVLTRFDDVTALRDESVYSVSHIRFLREPIDGLNVMQLDGGEHRRNRALVSPGFRAKVLNHYLDETCEPLARRLIDGLRERGRVDLMSEFCEPFPFFTIADLLGLHTDDQPRLSKVYKDAIAANPLETGPEELERSLAARDEFTAMLEPIVAERRRRPTDDFVSQLVTARSGDDALTDDEVMGFLRFMLPAGEESTMSALGTLLLELLRRPDAAADVVADPAVLTTAVEEGLRWRAPIAYVNRLTLVDQVLHGVEVPAGSLVLGAVNGANRDPSVFDEPDRFDVRRSPNRHVSFGTGVHNCIGAPLARAELRIGVRALLESLPGLRLAPGYEPTYHGLFSNALTSLDVEFDAA